jgi:hypothetical protein
MRRANYPQIIPHSTNYNSRLTERLTPIGRCRPRGDSLAIDTDRLHQCEYVEANCK